MKKMFRSQFNYPKLPSDLETVKGVSETVEGMDYTVKELIARHARGISPAITKVPVFNGGEFDDVDPTSDPAFDLADATILQDELKQKAEARKLAVKEKAKKAAEAELATTKKAESELSTKKKASQDEAKVKTPESGKDE